MDFFSLIVVKKKSGSPVKVHEKDIFNCNFDHMREFSSSELQNVITL
jgi:hypothetical protein